MTDFKQTLVQLTQNLNLLHEREAKYGGNAPLELLNQIEDHQTAITLTEQALKGELSEAAWREALNPLLLAIHKGQVIHLQVETYIAGEVRGDFVGGDKVEGDKVFGDKIITHIYEAPPPPLPPAEAKERRELGILLAKVKQFWIEGVLEKSVHQVALIDLGKETQAEAVAHAWEQVLELPDQSRQTLPPDKKISQIFEEMNRALLILGAPGSGKTITLLQLAQDLIAQAEADKTFSQPIPVVFNLSSWVDKKQPLLDWLVTELTAKYQIPKRVGRPWLENNRLLPLLDGLDEVKPENRAACVEAINEFGAEFGLAGLVVCSRLKEYIHLPVRLKLNGAIRLQPLTLEQIYDYLDGAGSKLDSLRTTLQGDDSLREMARSPLILGIMSLAYQDVPLENMTHKLLNTPEKRRKHLFDTYVERMFRRTGQREKPYSDEQTKSWLSYLAQEMTGHNLSIFQIEELQPSWLSSHAWRWTYLICSRVTTMIIVGVSLELLMGIVDAQLLNLATPLISGLLGWLIAGLSLGLCGGLIVAVYSGFLYERQTNNHTEKKPPSRRQWIFYTLGLSFILVVVSSFILVVFTGPIFGLMNGLVVGVMVGIAFAIEGQQLSWTYDIQPFERLAWSWRNALKILPLGLLGGSILGLVFGFIFSYDESLVSRLSSHFVFPLPGGPNFVLSLGLFFALLTGVYIATIAGISTKVADEKTAPSQGIWLSLRNAMFIGTIFGLLGLLTSWVISGWILATVANGLVFGVLGALKYGGGQSISHLILTAMLWYKGHIPRRYIHFLDYGVDRVFLQKVGGGYIFIHRLLLEHFATLESKQ